MTKPISLLILAIIGAVSVASAEAVEKKPAGLPRSNPEAQGVPSAALLDLVEAYLTLKLRFAGDELFFDAETNVGFRATKQPQLVGRAE